MLNIKKYAPCGNEALSLRRRAFKFEQEPPSPAARSYDPHLDNIQEPGGEQDLKPSCIRVRPSC